MRDFANRVMEWLFGEWHDHGEYMRRFKNGRWQIRPQTRAEAEEALNAQIDSRTW